MDQDKKSEPVVELFKGNWLSLLKRGRFEFCHRHRQPDAVCIVPVTKDNKLIVVVQYRNAVDCNVIEPPAGLVDPGETVIQTANRELLEETGYVGGIVNSYSKVSVSPGTISEKLHFIVMTDCYNVENGGGIDGENITVELIDLTKPDSDLTALAKKHDAIFDTKLFSALYMARSLPSKELLPDNLKKWVGDVGGRFLTEDEFKNMK